MSLRKRTSIIVDTDFFNKVFEPGRKNAEKDLGIKLSQTKFTKILTNNGFKMPITNFNKKIKILKGRKNEKPFKI